MIKKFSLDKSRVMEFFQAMTNVKNFLAKENLQTLQLEKYPAGQSALGVLCPPKGFPVLPRRSIQRGRKETAYFIRKIWEKHSGQTPAGGDRHHYQSPTRHSAATVSTGFAEDRRSRMDRCPESGKYHTRTASQQPCRAAEHHRGRKNQSHTAGAGRGV